MSRQLPAFTLMEIMAAMTITAVVLSLSFYGFRLLQLQFSQYEKQQNKVEMSRRCLTLLRRDIDRSRYLFQAGTQISCYNKQDTVVYSFESGRVIRQYGGTYRDSFAVNLNLRNTPFQQQFPISPLIDQLAISVDMTDFSKELILRKNYSAADLLQWERAQILTNATDEY